MSKDLELPTGMSGDLAIPSGMGGKSIAVIEAPLHPHAQAFQAAKICEQVLMRGVTISVDGHDHHLPRMYFNARGIPSTSEEGRLKAINNAKLVCKLLLPFVISINEAVDKFSDFIDPNSENNISPAQASVMVHGLVDAIAGKRRTEDDQAKLDAMLLMFNPMINAIGSATELWGEVPRHPVVVSLAIISMMIKTQTFCPAPAELAQACRRARGKLRAQLQYMQDVIDNFIRAETIMFEYARDDWTALWTKENLQAVTDVCMDAHMDGENGEWDAGKYRAWYQAIDEIERQMDLVIIREILGKADVVKANVQNGGAVPRGVTPLPIPDELLEKVPDFDSRCQYFLTKDQIALVEGDKVTELIGR